MADISNYSSLSTWGRRVQGADRAHEAWENRFNCQKLYEYYENFQWKRRTDSPQLNYQPYTLNLFHSTIEIKLASYLFQRPSFILSPEPGHSHWNLDLAVLGAQIKQDTLNTIVKNRNLKFAKTLKRAALDAFFRFGMIEVGYAADWRNPLKDDPQLKSWEDDDLIDSEKDRVVQDEEVPQNERFFVKRIKPKRFRVSVSDAEDMDEHEWVGYYQFYYEDTLRETKGINFPSDGVGSYVSSDFSADSSFSRHSSGLFMPDNKRKICKVWHIWDLVAKKRRMLLADADFTEIWSDVFERLPLIDLRWFMRDEGFYPIPPSWYWLSSQDEINESREQVRSFRRRFTRKFQALENRVEPEEVEKFASGPDGVVITVKEKDAISPISNPEIGATQHDALVQAKDDFLIVSGTSAEARPGGDRETATKSKLADARARIRESAEQIEFSEFACTIGREILCQAQERLVEGLWVKYSSDPVSDPAELMQEVQSNAPAFKYITSQDLSDGYDFDISVDIQNATPAAMEAAQQAFVNFVTFLNQFPMVAMDPDLIRETAYRFGYKNEKMIRKIQQVAITAMQAKAAEAANGNFGPVAQMAPGRSGGGGNANNTAKKQMATPDQSEIGNQLSNQLQ